MTLTTIKHRIGGTLMGVLFLFSIGMMASTTAQAQWPWPNNQDQYRRDQDRNNRRDDRWDNRNNRGRRGRNGDGYGNFGGSYELRQTALNAGYNEGMKEGRKDRNGRDRYDFRDEGAYQRANKDYNSRLGDRYIYQRYFREAFENGYADGYGYSGYGN